MPLSTHKSHLNVLALCQFTRRSVQCIEFCQFRRTVMSKPREFAHLIKNKFGSADNINSLGKSSFYTGELSAWFLTRETLTNRSLHQGIEESGGSEEDQNSQQSQRIHHGSATLPANASSHQHSSGSGGRFPHGSEEGASECSSATSESLPPPPQHPPQNQNTNLSNAGDAGTTPQQQTMTSPRRRVNNYTEVSDICKYAM
jgi:hypothetical protein